jgi:type I pantothenate kinase
MTARNDRAERGAGPGALGSGGTRRRYPPPVPSPGVAPEPVTRATSGADFAAGLGPVADLVRSRRAEARSFVVGIAGAVASGKSTLAATVRDLLVPLAVDVVSTDGFLFDNATLQARGLLMHKGFPDSYDTDRLTRFVLDVRAGGAPVAAPVYSHEVYDVLPGAEQVIDRPDVLIVEGVNALSALAPVLDLRVYVDASEEDLETWYVKRFCDLVDEARRDPASFFASFLSMSPREIDGMARSVWRSVNLPNLHDHIGPSRDVADCVVTKNHDHTVRNVWVRAGWRGDGDADRRGARRPAE